MASCDDPRFPLPTRQRKPCAEQVECYMFAPLPTNWISLCLLTLFRAYSNPNPRVKFTNDERRPRCRDRIQHRVTSRNRIKPRRVVYVSRVSLSICPLQLQFPHPTEVLHRRLRRGGGLMQGIGRRLGQ